jgi:hypothetical protein
MKIYLFIALAILADGLYCTRAAAQSTDTDAGPTTNLIVTTTLNLTAYIQNPSNGPLPSVTIQKLTTKDIIAAIETELGLPTNDVATAKLLLKWNGVGGTNFVPVAEFLRTSAGDTNVDSVFSIAGGNTSLGNLTVSTIRSNIRSGTSTETDFTIAAVSLNTTNAQLSFSAQGQAKISLSSVASGKTLVDPRAFPLSYSISLTGSGTVGTNSAVFTGTFTAGNRKVETQ